jgi:hypothetical protein
MDGVKDQNKSPQNKTGTAAWMTAAVELAERVALPVFGWPGQVRQTAETTDAVACRSVGVGRTQESRLK